MYPNITHIVVHASDSPEGRKDTAADIDRWHKAKGWRKIGYHSVIEHDKVSAGRDLREMGAHVRGHNKDTWGVCYIGGRGLDGKTKDTLTDVQETLLVNELQRLKALAPNAIIVGHRDLDKGKACPCFDVNEKFGWLNE